MFDPDNLNPSTRFPWPHESRDKNGEIVHEWVDFRVAADEDLFAIRKKLGIKEKVFNVINPETRAINRTIGSNVEENDEMKKLINDEVNDFCITAWYLITDAGIEIECSRENKIKFMNQSPLFRDFARDSLEKIRAGAKAQSEIETKN
jgi:hypothetical protein